MKNLMRLEFRRLSRKKSLYICLGLAILMLLWLSYSAKALADLYGVSRYSAAATQLAVDLLLSAMEFSLFTTFLCVFICLFVCEDYSLNTVKNILARGCTRGQLYFGKLISTLTATSVMFVLLLSTAFFLNLRALGNGTDVPWGTILIHLGAQYVITLAYMSLYYVIATMFRKSGAAIATGLLLPIIFGIILRDRAYDYWLGSMSTDLTLTVMEPGRLPECLWVPAIYIGASLTAGYFWHKKADL